MKKIITMVLCFAMALSLSVPAFAAAPSSSPAETSEILGSSKDGTWVTMEQHYDVVIHKAPSLTSESVGTLYRGDRVYVTEWNAAVADGYTWAHIVFGNVDGYVVNTLLG